jgi:PTS system N-acetylgalactosamine-specific IIC component
MALIAILVFILTLDQSSFLRVLHRPLIACTLFGIVLNDPAKGAAVGAAMELIVLGAENRYVNTVLYSVMAVVLAVQSGMDVNTAIASALVFAWLGMYADGAFTAISAAFLPMARKAAENRDEKKLALANFLPGILKALLFTVLACLAYTGGESFRTTVSSLEKNAGWVMAGLAAAGSLMKCLGFAVILRNIQIREISGALVAGAAFAALIVTTGISGATLLICAMLAFALAAYDYSLQANETAAAEKGGASKWW